MAVVRCAQVNCASEWFYASGKPYADPFNEITLDVEFTSAGGRLWRVPAFWTGDQEWCVRFAPPEPGDYRFRTVCSDDRNPDLHGREGLLRAQPYGGQNPLLKHGPLRASADRRYLEHADGVPFFWLGDTWWNGLTAFIRWPDEFLTLVEDRRQKGFSVIQLVAGLFPELEPFDLRSANEAGQPWEPDYARIRPAYYDMADLRIQSIVRAGLVPCIFACWGYHLHWLGVERMKRYWRWLVARYSAYPVVWCLAGEGVMPYYTVKGQGGEEAQVHATFQKRGWTDVARYLRRTDPMRHPVTIHPPKSARDCVEDDSLLDLDMLQTGHGGLASLPDTVAAVVRARARTPTMPVINGEVCYEAHQQRNWQDVQRLMFWVDILSGCAGHTYGAGGLWQMNRPELPLGPTAKRGAYENTPWQTAMQLPGSTQLALAKGLLLRYPWWRLEPHPEWVQPRWTEQNYLAPYAAGIPRQLRIVYIPTLLYHWTGPVVKALEAGVSYHAFYADPITGAELPIGPVHPTPEGDWQAPDVTLAQDWLLVLEQR